MRWPLAIWLLLAVNAYPGILIASSTTPVGMRKGVFYARRGKLSRAQRRLQRLSSAGSKRGRTPRCGGHGQLSAVGLGVLPGGD